MPEMLTGIIRYLNFFAFFIRDSTTLWIRKTTA